jgi:hypothetical protein
MHQESESITLTKKDINNKIEGMTCLLKTDSNQLFLSDHLTYLFLIILCELY